MTFGNSSSSNGILVDKSILNKKMKIILLYIEQSLHVQNVYRSKMCRSLYKLLQVQLNSLGFLRKVFLLSRKTLQTRRSSKLKILFKAVKISSVNHDI